MCACAKRKWAGRIRLAPRADRGKRRDCCTEVFLDKGMASSPPSSSDVVRLNVGGVSIGLAVGQPAPQPCNRKCAYLSKCSAQYTVNIGHLVLSLVERLSLYTKLLAWSRNKCPL